MTAWTSTASTRARWARMLRLLPGSGMGGVGTWREAVTPTGDVCGRGSVGHRAGPHDRVRCLDGRSYGHVGAEGLERGQVGDQVGRLAAGLGGVAEGEVRRADAGPAAGGVTGHGEAGPFGGDGAGGGDRLGGDVAE